MDVQPRPQCRHPSVAPQCSLPAVAVSYVLCGVRAQVEILVRLKGHPNIVSIEDAFEDQSAVHIVQELCSGGPLCERIARQVPPGPCSTQPALSSSQPPEPCRSWVRLLLSINRPVCQLGSHWLPCHGCRKTFSFPAAGTTLVGPLSLVVPLPCPLTNIIIQ